MEDKALYQQILDWESPWNVPGVELDTDAGEIGVRSERRFAARSATARGNFRVSIIRLSDVGAIWIHASLGPR